MSATTPNPATVFGNRKPMIAAPINASEVATPHDPTKHDGIVKAKHLESVAKGLEVRAYLNGAPRGGVRVVESVERLGDGATVRITWSSAHAPSEHKAAYRWFVPSLVGTPIKPAAKRRPRRKPEQMTAQIAASLSDEKRGALEALVGAL